MSKVILVTGASSGLGQSIASQLHHQGHIVYGTSRSPRTEFPFPMLIVDVTKEDSVLQAIQHIKKEQGQLNWLINNAGIGMASPTEQFEMSSAESVIDTNVLGLLRVTKAALPLMRQTAGGKIINISSIGSVVGLPFRGIYCASKAGVDMITESLRFEVTPLGLQACSVRAGDIQTNINANRIREYDAYDDTYKARFESTYKEIERDVEKGISADEVARRIIKIAHQNRLRPYYNIGKPIQRLAIVFKRLLPSSIFEWILKQYLNKF